MPKNFIDNYYVEAIMADDKVLQFGDLSFTYSMDEENAANLFFTTFLKNLGDEELILTFLEKIMAKTEGKDNHEFEKILTGYFCNPENFIDFARNICYEVVDVCENEYREKIFADFNRLYDQFRSSSFYQSMKDKELDGSTTALNGHELVAIAEAFMYAYLDATYFNELSPVKAFIWVIKEKMEEIFILFEIGLIEIGFDEKAAENIIGNVKKIYSENGRELI